MIKKIILNFFIFIFIPLSFAFPKATAPAVIIGPKNGPPTKAEVQKMKYTLDPEFIGKKPEEKKSQEGFWDWLIKIILSWFN